MALLQEWRALGGFQVKDGIFFSFWISDTIEILVGGKSQEGELSHVASMPPPPQKRE